jgi:enoyl-CoA hydratase/carnithine racemase
MSAFAKNTERRTPMDFFSIAKQGNIGILTMNRPPMNNFNLQMYRELQ